jgi:hypothetical protein
LEITVQRSRIAATAALLFACLTAAPTALAPGRALATSPWDCETGTAASTWDGDSHGAPRLSIADPSTAGGRTR